MYLLVFSDDAFHYIVVKTVSECLLLNLIGFLRMNIHREAIHPH